MAFKFVEKFKNNTVVDVTEKQLDDLDKVKTIDQRIADVVKHLKEAPPEGSKSFLAAIKQHPSVFFWASLVSVCVIMIGYDQALVPTFFALPAFLDKFGFEGPDGKYIPPSWQTGLSLGSVAGQFLGPLIVPWPMEKWGRKMCVFVSSLLIIAINFMQFFSPSIGVLCAGETIGGIIWGAFYEIGVTYNSEIAPTKLRPMINSLTNLAFVTGQLLAQGVQTGFQSRVDKWAYKIPFAIQWVWPVILIVGIYFAPESPWWLIRKQRYDHVKKSLKQLGWPDSNDDSLDVLIEHMRETDEMESNMEKNTSYLECFKGASFRRTEIALMMICLQYFVGVWLISYMTYFFQLAGLETDDAFYLAMGTNGISFVMTISSWWVGQLIPRRTLILTCLSIMTLVLITMGCLDSSPSFETVAGYRWAVALMFVVWTIFYQISIGPLCFVIMSEVPSTRLRSRTIALGIACSSIVAIAFGVALPYMFDDGWRGKTGFFFGGMSTLVLCWTYFRLPDTKDRTSGEIDIMFELEIPVRKFRSFNVETFAAPNA